MLNQSPMNRYQIFVVLVCVLLTALDGFDVLAISFAAPGVADEWQVSRARLGVVLGMELLGMGLGSILLGGMADRLGRRPTVLFCLMLMTVGMYGASLVQSVNQLLLVRFFTGLGIGGMLASTNALVAEFSNARHRNLAVILMAGGYPLGVIAGGSVAVVLLEYWDWRAIFLFGAAATAAFFLLAYLCLPESIEFLANRRPANALQRINATLHKMGHAAIEQLPEIASAVSRSGYQTLFSTEFRRLTLLLSVGYFAHIMTFYFFLKWLPKIVVDMGHAASSAGGVLVWANVGGIVGVVSLGLLAGRFSLRKLLVAIFFLSFLFVSAFGFEFTTLTSLSVAAATIGFFTNAGVVGYYALLASTFPAAFRASGTGMVIGVGRGGAIMGPVVAGLLFSSGLSLLQVCVIMGAGGLISAVSMILLGLLHAREDRADST
ncbi:MAG: MFS transporter [Congregibacter sp.]